MKKNFLLFLLSLFLFVSLIQPVFSDGGMYYYDPQYEDWQLQTEEKQLCAINYENGIQNMILEVNIPEINGEKAVWIFPVPAKPEEITIDVIEGFPRFDGENVEQLKSRKVNDTFTLIGASQVYTWPFFVVGLLLGGMAGASVDAAQGRYLEAYNMLEGLDVTVHEHIEKKGLTTELITAGSGEDFYDYLYYNDLKLPMYSENLFKEYVGKEYSFVVSWLSDPAEFDKSGSVGVYTSFPTEKIYFPLKPTSVYENEEIPIYIYVLNHVTPELYTEILGDTEVNYFIDDYYGNTGSLSAFFNSKSSKNIKELKYTKIEINSQAKNFKEDLWIESTVPLHISFYNFIIEESFWFTLILFILISCVASLIAARTVFKKDNPNLFKFALFGLANFLTLIGFCVLSYLLKIDERFTEKKKTNKKKFEVKKILLTTAIVSAIVAFVFLLPFILLLFGSLFAVGGSGVLFLFYALFSLVFFFLFIFVFVLIFVSPFVWGYYTNFKLFKFTILFALFFLIITFLLWALF